ncbi:RNA polymerase sigma factor [Microbacterium testaceum]|uniref:RNA polymerase sigma factor n=1 Tax=Microbacterium testaceum TaxID=2033 RepID=UPI001FEB02BB|nr:RNA polymerase sigma factor [Microbacterium testaceum]
MNVSDGEIITRSLTDRAAFVEVYDRHERVVYRYTARRLGQTWADDITSETFMVAFSRRDDFVGDDARSWLLGIATTLMRRHVREEAKAWKGMLASDLAQIDVDQFDEADSRLDATGAVRKLGKALARLPSGDRDALLLHTFADLDYLGISRALSIPIGTVRSRLNRARRKLQQAIDPARGREMEEHRGRNLAAAPSTD